MQHRLPWFFSLLVVCILGCHRQPDTQVDRITESYRLIDAQRSDEAIALLEEELVDNPGNTRARVTLASAYAHKAGFKIQAFWNLISAAQRQEISRLRIEDSKTHAAAQFVTFLRSTIRIGQAIDQLPDLDGARFKYLEHALGILDSIGDSDKKPGDHLLSALYRLIIFKARVGWMYRAGSFARKNKIGECRVELDRVTDSVLDSARLLERITFDLSKADPKRTADYQLARKSLAHFAKNVTMNLDTLVLLDEAFKTAFKAELVQKGLGSLTECSQSSNNTFLESPLEI